MQHIFILGNPRSGTSLFRLMLHQHSEVVAPPESGFAHWWYSKYCNWQEIDAANNSKVAGFIKDISESKKIETWELDYTVLLATILKTRPANYQQLISLVYTTYKKSQQLKVIVDKNNYYINHLDDLPKIWPTAKFIQLVRDGRDVACSYMDIKKLSTNSQYKPKLATNITEIAKEWSFNNRRIIEFGEAANREMLTIRYEDLITSTQETLKTVCSFMDIPFEASMLAYYQEKSEGLKEPSATLDWKKKTKEKPDSSRIGRFEKYLSEDQINSFNNVAREMLSHFNYE